MIGELVPFLATSLTAFIGGAVLAWIATVAVTEKILAWQQYKIRQWQALARRAAEHRVLTDPTHGSSSVRVQISANSPGVQTREF